MINAQRTGAYISQLRKARDWTQAELAEKLHVTHQAVSQWEKGAAFPDISLLPNLARYLGVSVDALLSGEPVAASRRVTRGSLVEGLARGSADEVARMVQDDPDGMELMLETAPLARPSQLNAVVGQLAGHTFTLEQAKRLAPFVAPEVLQGLLERAGVDTLDAETLRALAPFLETEAVDRLAARLPAGALGLEDVKSLAPFLGGGALHTQVQRVLDSDQTVAADDIESLAPHLDEADLHALLDRLGPGEVAIDFVLGVAPFVGADTLDGLIGRLDDPAATGEHLEGLAPFLSAAGLRRAVAQAQDRLTADKVVALAPFLDRETLAGLLRAGGRA